MLPQIPELLLVLITCNLVLELHLDQHVHGLVSYVLHVEMMEEQLRFAYKQMASPTIHTLHQLLLCNWQLTFKPPLALILLTLSLDRVHQLKLKLLIYYVIFKLIILFLLHLGTLLLELQVLIQRWVLGYDFYRSV